MIVFAHRGIGFGKEENSLEAVRAAVRRKFSVEIDLRMKRGGIILSHDYPEEIISSLEFNKLLIIIKENPDLLFALHLKEDSEAFFKKISKAVNGIKNLFLFVTDFPQRNFIMKMFNILGSEQLALYVTSKVLDRDLINRTEYFWLDESKSGIYKEIHFFGNFKKKIIYCSPELFLNAKKSGFLERNKFLKESSQGIFGICTDFCSDYTT